MLRVLLLTITPLAVTHVAILVESQNFPIPPVFLPPPMKKGFPWNWVQALEIKNANDGAIGPKRS